MASLAIALDVAAEHRAHHAAEHAATALRQPTVFLQSEGSPRHKPVPAIAKNQSEDKKLTSDPQGRPVAATYVSQWACPETCPFLGGGGCYTEQGHIRFITARLNSSGYRTPEELAVLEAEAILGLSGYHPLRLHVIGDSKTNAAARIVSDACADYTRKHGARVWTYTHAWREVDRVSWQGVSVLASCETEQDVSDAHARGYAVERTVTSWEEATPITTAAGTTLKPFRCLEQTGAQPDCEACGFCTRDTAWRNTAYLALLGHGATKKLGAAIAFRVSGN